MSWKRWLFCNQKAFLLQVVLHELKNSHFNQTKTFVEKFLYCTWKSSAFTKQKVFYFQKALRIALKNHLFVHKKLFFCTSPSSLFSKISHFHKPKAFYLHKPFLITIQSNSFPPSISHSHPAITYCPPKNTAVLLISALTPYAVTPEPRTDSKPFRRRFVQKAGFGSCRWKTLLKSSSTELWIVPGSPEGRNPLGYFWFFSYKRKE